MPTTPTATTTMPQTSLPNPCLPESDDADYKRDLRAYVEKREPVGPFLRAILENNLRAAIAHASPSELTQLHKVVSFVLWRLPAVSHGDKKTVASWLKGNYAHIRALDE